MLLFTTNYGPAILCMYIAGKEWYMWPSALMIDMFVRQIVAWKASTSMTTAFVLGALEKT